MRARFVWATLPVVLSFACGASFPVPTQRMADAKWRTEAPWSSAQRISRRLSFT